MATNSHRRESFDAPASIEKLAWQETAFGRECADPVDPEALLVQIDPGKHTGASESPISPLSANMRRSSTSTFWAAQTGP
jgi:hypothetical protein